MPSSFEIDGGGAGSIPDHEHDSDGGDVRGYEHESGIDNDDEGDDGERLRSTAGPRSLLRAGVVASVLAEPFIKFSLLHVNSLDHVPHWDVSLLWVVVCQDVSGTRPSISRC